MVNTQTDRIKTALDQIFQERDALFPVRDRKNSLEMNKLQDIFSSLVLNKAQKRSNELDHKAIDKAFAMLDSPVVICGYPKSGTTLLCNLLDGHPALTVLPGDARMKSWLNVKNHAPYSAHINHFLKYLTNPRGQRPFWFLGKNTAYYSDFVNYYKFFYKKLPDDSLNHFVSGVLALHCANPNSSTQPQAWVEKTPLNEFYVSDILDRFPKSRFIHIVRNPLANLASVKRLYRNRSVRKTERIRYWLNVLSTRFCAIQTKQLQNSMNAGLENQKALGKSCYLMIRYEDLTADLEQNTRLIANFLNISWKNSLLKPTNNNKSVVANSMYASRKVEGRVISGIGDYWKREFSTIEMLLAKNTLADISTKYGYDLKTA